MTPEQWARVREMFTYLVDKSPGHRADYLDIACETEPQLRAEVDAMLSAHDELGPDPVDALSLTKTADPPSEIQGYTLGDELGSGGMGAVYRAEHAQYGPVALKLVPAFAVAEPRARQRFEREAAILRAQNHPALCVIYESFVSDAFAGIAMELIEGQNLSQRVPTAPARAIDIIVALAEALGPLHALGVVHRDLKPGNVLVTPTGAVKLIDFGIAKFADEKLTQTGQVLGTPCYMAPEQWQGATLDHRADLWALGCLLYELLAGQPAFKRSDMMETARAVLSEPPEPLPQTGEALQRIVTDLLSKDPADRIASCNELITRLNGL
ncbi:MAG: serine/threonine-protein kinase [Pseudomonadota bacterium]